MTTETLTSEEKKDLEQILSPSQRKVLELVEDNFISRPTPNFGWTIKEYQEYRSRTKSISEETARTELLKLVKDGVLERKKVVYPERILIYYPKGTWPES